MQMGLAAFPRAQIDQDSLALATAARDAGGGSECRQHSRFERDANGHVGNEGAHQPLELGAHCGAHERDEYRRSLLLDARTAELCEREERLAHARDAERRWRTQQRLASRAAAQRERRCASVSTP